MKRNIYFIIIIAMISLSLFAQKTKQGITAVTGQFSTSFIAQQQNDAVILPFLEGKHLTGSKERYGILFRSAQVKNAFFEILDGNGKAIRTILVNDFIGKSTASDVKLLSNSVTGNGRASETVHELTLAEGSMKLITRALLAGDKANPNNPEQIIITFSLSASTKQNYALRLNLPTEGTAEIKNNGVVLSGKSSASAIALSVMPNHDSMFVKKNTLIINSSVVAVSGDTPMIWLVVRNATAATQSLSKNLAADGIAKFNKKNGEPNIVIVNMISKENAQPGDTVTYTLICKNIGLAAASDIMLSNPIPTGTKYLDGTATVEKTELTTERSTVPPPQTSPVSVLRWKLKDALESGKELSVKFNVVIQ